MKKKLLSLLLATVMVTSLLTGCTQAEVEDAVKEAVETGDTSKVEQIVNENKPTATPTAEPTKAAEVKGEAIPEAKYYFSFDNGADESAIHPAQQNKKNSGADIIEKIDKPVAHTTGVKGESLWVDGGSGYKLDVNGVGDVYTISFWVYPCRFATYMPTIQYGPDVHGDATDNQHYVNFTRAEWNPDGACFPCVWAYDQADDAKWPFWYIKEADEHVKQWTNITMTVDPAKLTEDGNLIAADIYINGQKYEESGSVNLVFNTMEASDNFDFLVGVNYWDATFKGAFDELYIFDQILTDGQIKTLYDMGDPTVKFVEPERKIEVKVDESAIKSLGTTDYKCEFGKELSGAIEIADGETMQVKLHNWSDGKDTKNNYALLFTKGKSENPAKDAFATVYADASGLGEAANEKNYEYSWGNWKTFAEKAMVDVTTTLKITRTGNLLEVIAENVDFNTTNNRMAAKFETSLADSDKLVLYLTAQNAYVDILSVKNVTVKTGGKVVGATDCSTAFWNVFSDIVPVPMGTTYHTSFINHTAGAESWQNFVAVVQSTPTGHNAITELPEGYEEFAVLRADNWGWGTKFGNTAEDKACDWNWETIKSDLDGAYVDAYFTNDAEGNVSVKFVARTADDKVYTQTYTNIAAGQDVFVSFTLEAAYLEFPAKDIVGATDCSTAFWTEFSDIHRIPVGGSYHTNFINHTLGGETWQNFVAIIQNTAAGHNNITANLPEGYKEYAVLRADNWGWGTNFANTAEDKSCDWNWETIKSDLDGAFVDATFTNDGTNVEAKFVVTTTDGKVYHQNYTNIAVEGDAFVSFTLERAWLEFDAPYIVGKTDCTSGWWSTFSPLEKVDGVYYDEFTNHGSGANVWNNFNLILQATATGHNEVTPVLPEGYKEYAVVRCDNWGWGTSFANGNDDKDNDWQAASVDPAKDLEDARIFVKVTVQDGVATVELIYGLADGREFHQNYRNIAVDGDVYACYVLDASWLELDR